MSVPAFLAAANGDPGQPAEPLSPAELEALVEGVKFILDRLGMNGIELLLRHSRGHFTARTFASLVESLRRASASGSIAFDVATHLADLRPDTKP